VDPQAYRYMIRTEGWQYFEQEIRNKIEYHKGRLLDCKTWDEVQQHRGSIESLESVLVHIQQTIKGDDENEEASA